MKILEIEALLNFYREAVFFNYNSDIHNCVNVVEVFFRIGNLDLARFYHIFRVMEVGL